MIKIPVSLFKHLMDKGDKKYLKSHQTFGVYNTTRNLSYLGENLYSRSHYLDIYSPVDGYNGITIFNIHGGGYFQGDKDYSEIYCSYFVNEGFQVINLNYPLIDNFENIDIRTQIYSLVMAINFIYDNRHKYNINVDKLCLMGDSAGGHLALMIAIIFLNHQLSQYYQIPYLAPVCFKAVHLSSSMYDYEGLRKLANKYLYRSGISKIFSKYLNDSEYLKNNSPKTYINDLNIHLPPLFIITSINDFFKEETIKLHLDLSKRSAEHIYHYEKSVDKKLGHIYNHFNFDLKEVQTINLEIVHFFIKKCSCKMN